MRDPRWPLGRNVYGAVRFARVEANEDVVVTRISRTRSKSGHHRLKSANSMSRPSIAASQKRIAASCSPTAVALRASTNGWTYSRAWRSTNDS